MVSRLGYKWEIAKTEDTTINGQPYTLIVLREKGKTYDCEMKSFVEKGLLKDRKGRPTELGRVIKTILKKQKERTSLVTDTRLFRDDSE